MSDGDRDDSTPRHLNFSSVLVEPEWLTCGCGEQAARVPCWNCERAAEVRVRNADSLGRAVATIPPRYAWARLDAPELAERVKAHEPLEQIVRRVLAAERVVFAGPSGAGKTSLAIACLRERSRHGAIFISALKLGTARIQSRAGDGESALVERAMSAPLVLLDEVGGEQKTATNAVRDVLFDRYDNDRPTWITTGFRGEQLVGMYGDGAFRRLTEGVCVVQLGGR